MVPVINNNGFRSELDTFLSDHRVYMESNNKRCVVGNWQQWVIGRKWKMPGPDTKISFEKLEKIIEAMEVVRDAAFGPKQDQLCSNINLRIISQYEILHGNGLSTSRMLIALYNCPKISDPEIGRVRDWFGRNPVTPEVFERAFEAGILKEGGNLPILNLLKDLMPQIQRVDSKHQSAFFQEMALLKDMGLALLNQKNCSNFLAHPDRIVDIAKTVGLFHKKKTFIEIQLIFDLTAEMLPNLVNKNIAITPHLLNMLMDFKRLNLLEDPANRVWAINHPDCVFKLMSEVRDLESLKVIPSDKIQIILNTIARMLPRLDESHFSMGTSLILGLLMLNRAAFTDPFSMNWIVQHPKCAASLGKGIETEIRKMAVLLEGVGQEKEPRARFGRVLPVVKEMLPNLNDSHAEIMQSILQGLVALERDGLLNGAVYDCVIKHPQYVLEHSRYVLQYRILQTLDLHGLCNPENCKWCFENPQYIEPLKRILELLIVAEIEMPQEVLNQIQSPENLPHIESLRQHLERKKTASLQPDVVNNFFKSLKDAALESEKPAAKRARMSTQS